MVAKEIVRIRKMLTKNDLNTNQLVGSISFLYNHPVNQKIYVKRINTDWATFTSNVEAKSKSHVWMNGVRQGGLLTRRKEELKLITNTI